jgi:hypothetical protein
MRITRLWLFACGILMGFFIAQTPVSAQTTPTPNRYCKLFSKAGGDRNLVLDRTKDEKIIGIKIKTDTDSWDPSLDGVELKSGKVNLQNGIPLQLWGGPGTTKKDRGVNQHWKLIDLGNGEFGLQSRENPLFWVDGSYPCAGIPGPGCKVQVWDSGSEFRPTENGVWLLEDAGNGYYRIRHKKSKLLMNAEGPEVKEGSRIQLFQQTGGDNELWQLKMLE